MINDIWYHKDVINEKSQTLGRLTPTHGSDLGQPLTFSALGAASGVYRVDTGLVCSRLNSLLMGLEDHRKHRALSINTVNE